MLRSLIRYGAALAVLGVVFLLAATRAEAQGPGLPDSVRVKLDSLRAVEVYSTEAIRANKSEVHLANGAIVDLGFREPFLGYGEKVILLARGRAGCELYVERKKYRCAIAKMPLEKPSHGMRTSVSGVRENGKILDLMFEGPFSVPIDSLRVAFWYYNDAILIGRHRLLNLVTGESVEVRPL